MPTYAYQCEKCKKHFEVILSVKEREEGNVECPECHGQEIKPVISMFFAVTSKKS